MDINIKELTIRIFQVDPLSKSLGENGNQMKQGLIISSMIRGSHNSYNNV